MCTEMPTAICACEAAGIASSAKATSSSRNLLNARIKFTFPVLGFALLHGPAGRAASSAFFRLNPFSL
jgi:hypothetical protein